MTLPATYERHLIESFEPMVDRVLDKLEADPEAANQILDMVCEQLVRGDFDRQHEIIKAAEDGDRLAHDALMRAYENQRNQHIEPTKLVEVYYLTHAKSGPPKRQRGRPATIGGTAIVNLRRDIGVCLMVALCYPATGRKPTRNEATEGASGASIVSAILRRKRVKISEDRINHIYGRWGAAVEATLGRWLRKRR
jgi:hypothetical protein